MADDPPVLSPYTRVAQEDRARPSDELTKAAETVPAKLMQRSTRRAMRDQGPVVDTVY